MMKDICKDFQSICLFVLCLFFTACIPEDIELPYRIMSVATGSSMNVTELSVTLSGNVTLIDSENITCGVIYGTSSNLSSSYGAKTLTNANGEFEVKISGLKANTTYYYRAYAVDAGRYKYGEVLSFTTKKNVAVTTGEAVGITTNSVNIKGTVNHAEKSLVCGIVYGTSSELSYKNGTIKSTTSSGDFSVNITGLNANTIYYYCAYVVVNGAYRYGGIRSFRTEQEVTITTNAATDITDSGATLGGTINNSDKSLTCGIIYGTSSSLSSSSGTKKSTTSSGDFFVNITGLNSNTTYYYRAYAIVDGEYKYGVVRSFNTKQKVSVETGSATDITDSSATLSGTISSSSQSLTCGIIYGTSSTLSSTSGTRKSTTSSGSYSVSINGLGPNTKYYYRAYVVVDGEYKYGDVRSFNTKLNSASISVTTGEATDITDSGATVSGAISGADQSLTCGVIYGTSSTLSSSSGTKKSTTSWSNYSLTLTGLKATTTYYYRAYAVIEGEYVYGEVRMFKTKETVAITTGTATDITESGATISGAISGTSQSLNCGIIYGTSSTLSSTSGTAKSTTSSGNFSISITGLKDNTTYYYRAYVVVDDKYVYGEVRSFKTLQRVTITTGAVTDITANGATLSGMVNGATHSYVCGIIYDTSSTLSSTSGTKHTVSSDGDYSFEVSGLKANTTYYYRAYVIIDDQYNYGEVRSFTTLHKAATITITTGGVTNITVSGATLSGTVSGSEQSLTCGIIYGTSSTLSSSSGTKQSITSSGVYSISISDLKANTTYYYRAFAVVDGEYVYGEVRSFMTKQVTITTGAVANITTNGATLSGMVNGATHPYVCGIIYGTSSTLSSASGTKHTVSSDGDYSFEVSGLKANTTYYYRAYIIVDDEYSYGEVRSFKTLQSGGPEAIDLGLSVKWATCNVGAESPEDYGSYYAWGETEEKSNYSWDTYKYWSDKDGDGYVDNNEITNIGSNISGTSYDVAHVKWGGSWRMPTLSEIQELCNKCSWQWTEVNGIKGKKVTGPNGNSIFLPAAGYRRGTEVYRGSGFYWSGSLGEFGSYYAFYLGFIGDGHNWNGYDYMRDNGHTVRPVTD